MNLGSIRIGSDLDCFFAAACTGCVASPTFLISSTSSLSSLPTGSLIYTRLYPNSYCVSSRYRAVKVRKYRITQVGSRTLGFLDAPYGGFGFRIRSGLR